jgi:hypothetical protein
MMPIRTKTALFGVDLLSSPSQEIQMAESSSGGSNNALYFIVGGLVVVVGVFAYVFFGHHGGSAPGKLDITITAPKTP